MSVARARAVGLITLVAMGAGLALSPLALLAQSRIRSDIDTTVVTIGDRITLSVSVEHDVAAEVEWPDSAAFGPFELLEVRTAEPETGDGRRTSTAAFSLVAFELGALEIPSVEVRVHGQAEGVETLRTDRFGIDVVSVGVDDGDIRDIRGPLAIPIGFLQVALWMVALMLLGTAVYALVRKLRTRSTTPDVGREPAPRPPHEIALAALARLEASSLPERGEIKRFHIEVSEILRRYVESRYGVAALEMTTWEVLNGLQGAGVDGDFRTGLGTFLDRCDLVKFAKSRPSAEASRDVLDLGRRLVESSVAPADREGVVT